MELWDEANKLHMEGKFDEAEPKYDDLLTQNHDNPGLLATMGTLQLQKQKPGTAMVFLHQAIRRMKENGVKVPSDVLSNLGLAYKYSGLTDEAQKYLRMAIDANGSAASYAVYAGMFVETGTPEKCISYSKIAIEKDPKLHLAHWNMSIAMLEMGNYEEGWDEYEYGFLCKSRVDRALGGFPRWDGKAKGKVCIYGEQGLGDEIMFASMIPDVMKTNEVVLETHRRLTDLFKDSFGVNCYGTREETEIHWPEDFDYQISAASLGQYYRRSKATFPGMPYLTSDAAPRGEKFRVGISWTGGKKTGRVLKRTVPLSWWKDILSQDCEFVSLQYTECEDEIRLAEQELGVEIKQFPEIKADDYRETAKMVMSCDLVISVCTSVIHLAGALGVPCWVMVPAHPAWRYGNKGPMPWYRSVRLYRAPASETAAWIPVVRKIADDLTNLIKERKAA